MAEEADYYDYDLAFISAMTLDNTTELCGDMLTQSDRSKILLAKGLTGAAGLVACIVSLIIFFLFQKFRESHIARGTGIIRRLVICMAVYAGFRSLAVILQTTAVDYEADDALQHGLCEFTGFLDQWSVWAMLLVIQMIVIHLSVQHISCGCCACGTKQSNIRRWLLEGFYWSFPVIFPLLFSWIPFIRDTYGLAGGWCWIRRENEDCSEFQQGLIEQVVFWFGPMVILEIWNMIFLLGIYPCLVLRIEEDRCVLIKQQAPLLLSLALSIIINWVSLGNRIAIGVGSNHNILGVWIFHAIASSCWGILAAMVILFHMCILGQQSPRMMIAGDNDKHETGIRMTSHAPRE